MRGNTPIYSKLVAFVFCKFESYIESLCLFLLIFPFIVDEMYLSFVILCVIYAPRETFVDNIVPSFNTSAVSVSKS